ncbi:MAG: hypothetical protein HYX47_18580 [Burkholderiales bacterium]|nr:hypothetical protein [Burkholderiales bacterium]
MHFNHSPEIWRLFPELVPGVLGAQGIHARGNVDAQVEQFNAIARARLAGVASETELPEIKAWRAVFQRMGLKPTQYRCAAESLLRRFRKEGALPRIHPLIDLCNAASLAFAVPVAVFDTARVAQWLQVRQATGAEAYLGFNGETEHPDTGEVVFADALDNAHARRWTHRQSGLSAVREGTASVLIVTEAMHASATAAADVPRLMDELARSISAVWGGEPRVAVLTPAASRFDF